MPCLLALIAVFFPRVVIVLLFLFTDYLEVYDGPLWPVLGFLLAPFTTLAYAFGMNVNGSISGLYLVIVVIAVLMDLGAWGGGASTRRREVVVVRRR